MRSAKVRQSENEGEFYWVTENGDKITTEDGDYIIIRILKGD